MKKFFLNRVRTASEEQKKTPAERITTVLSWVRPFADKRLWVPSPLVGEGQDRGSHGRTAAIHPLILSLSCEGRGDP